MSNLRNDNSFAGSPSTTRQARRLSGSRDARVHDWFQWSEIEHQVRYQGATRWLDLASATDSRRSWDTIVGALSWPAHDHDRRLVVHEQQRERGGGRALQMHRRRLNTCGIERIEWLIDRINLLGDGAVDMRRATSPSHRKWPDRTRQHAPKMAAHSAPDRV